MKIVFQRLAPLILLFLMLGCKGKDQQGGALLNEFVHLPSSGWQYDDVRKFTLSVSDTAKEYDIYLKVRNDKRYSYSNLWVYVKITSPLGDVHTVREEIILADDLGYWLGKAEGRSLHELDHLYQKAFRFPYLGIYSLELQHAMRDSILLNVTDIGVSVEPAK